MCFLLLFSCTCKQKAVPLYHNNNNNNSNSYMKKFFDSEACLLTIIGLGFVVASVCTFIQLLGKPHVSLIGYYTVSLVGFLGLVSLFLAGVIWHDDKNYK